MATNDEVWHFKSVQELEALGTDEKNHVEDIRQNYCVKIVDQILDSVHGFIGLTEIERKLIDLPVFGRLQNIKQLSLINRVFPMKPLKKD